MEDKKVEQEVVNDVAKTTEVAEETNDFEIRQADFHKRLSSLMEELSIDIYATNAMMPNQEVVPVIKMLDKKKNESNTKK